MAQMTTVQAASSEQNDVELRELVRRHQVRWESHPEQGLVGDALAQIGFVVELSAVHDHPAHPPSPGCAECAPVHEALRRIAEAVLPRGEHASWYDVHISSALHFGRGQGGRTELAATISILHRGTVNRPPDDCERACLEEVRGRLIALGVKSSR